ncbi:MAG: SH3 domain-containing protein [Lachnospiraceae bacterium]|nr:SH3 domain-containing protein [Lachnospiraceae bacterium]
MEKKIFDKYIKKLLVAVLIIAPVFAVLFFGLKNTERTSAATTGKVTAASLFVRTGPGTNYDKLTVNGKTTYLSKGDYVAISYETDGWYYITASFNGTKINGYVSAQYISTEGNVPTAAPSATPTPKAAATKTPTPTPGQTTTKKLTTDVVKDGFPLNGYVTAGKLNVRKDAGTSNDRIDSISKDQLVTVTSAKKASTGEYWYKITYTVSGSTKEGWVSQAYISVDLNSKPAPTAKPQATATPKPEATKAPAGPTPTPKVVTSVVKEGFPLEGYCNTSGLNVRKGPGTSYDKVTTLSQNQKVTITGYKTSTEGKVWYEITTTKNGTTYKGYASSVYMAVLVPGPTFTPVPTEKPVATETPVPKATATPAVEFIGEKIEIKDISSSVSKSYCYSAVVNTYQLNMREEPNTSSATVGTFSQGTKVLILDKVMTDSTAWYKVAVKKGGEIKYGYMSAKYTKLVFLEDVYATVLTDNLKLRSTVSATSAYVKLSDGSIAMVGAGNEVKIIDEVNQSGQKWFKIRTAGGTEGYVTANDATPAAAKKADPTPTPKPTATPKPEATKAPGATATPVPTQGPSQVVDSGEQIYDPYTGLPMYKYKVCEVKNGITTVVMEGTDYYFPAVSMSAPIGYMFDHLEVYPENVTTAIQSFVMAHTLTQNETYLYYYVRDPDASLQDCWDPDMTDEQFETYMDSQGFPESYKDDLRKIHADHPNWVLTANQTGISWDDAIASENVAGRNLIPNSYSIAWKSTETGAYNWSTDQFIVYDGSTWVTASTDALGYFIDPRNWLNDTNIFMFESLTYKPEYQDEEGVEALLVNTPFHNKSFSYVDNNGITRTTTYAKAFITAAEYSGVSPYHLASRVRQEIVTSSTTVSNSATGTVSGYEGLYNFYNIGAYHSTVSGGAIKNGLKYAKNGATNNDELNTGSLIPWTDPFRAIVGGAYVIGQNYINRGQDTIYLQKFNMTYENRFMHQYMANVVAPSSESKRLATAYTGSDKPITFTIPVFDNMPDEPSPKPEGGLNPNNWLADIKVYDVNGSEVSLAPTFNQKVDQEYYVTVPSYNDTVRIEATPVSTKATVYGTGYVGIGYGMNTFEVMVIAESGEVKNYILNVVRQDY